jgi:hypothetical protein
MQLTQNFSLEELTVSENAARAGIDNTPPDELMPNLRKLAEGLEEVRRLLRGLPIHINSGYRNPQVNKLVGGAANSRHMSALAADIVCPQFGEPLEVCRAIAAAGIPVDEIIHEYGRWCHVAFPERDGAALRKLMTISSSSGGYRPGLNPIG